MGDIKCVRRNALAGSFGIYCGVLTMISTSFQTFESLAVYCALFGIGGGLFQVIYRTKRGICVKYLELDLCTGVSSNEGVPEMGSI